MNLAIVYHDLCRHSPLSHLSPLSQHAAQGVTSRLETLIESAVSALQQGVVDHVSLYVAWGYQPGSPLVHDAGDIPSSLRALVEACPFPAQLLMPSASAPIFSPWQVVEKLPVDLVYLAEAALLYRADTVAKLLGAYAWGQETLAHDLIVTPYQDPSISGETQLLQAQDRHNATWRAVPQAGRSLLLPKGLLERFSEVFEYDSLRFVSGRQEAGNDLTPIFRLVPCIAPESALVGHGIEGTDINRARYASPTQQLRLSDV